MEENTKPSHILLDDYSGLASVEQKGRVVGQPFTLADSFYDAHANDVFLQRSVQPVSVEPPNADESLAASFEESSSSYLSSSFPSAPYEAPQTSMLVQRPVQHMSLDQKMEASFRIPVIATLVFVVTMIAIFYMGGQVGKYYAPVVQGGKVEFVGRKAANR